MKVKVLKNSSLIPSRDRLKHRFRIRYPKDSDVDQQTRHYVNHDYEVAAIKHHHRSQVALQNKLLSQFRNFTTLLL